MKTQIIGLILKVQFVNMSFLLTSCRLTYRHKNVRPFGTLAMNLMKPQQDPKISYTNKKEPRASVYPFLRYYPRILPFFASLHISAL